MCKDGVVYVQEGLRNVQGRGCVMCSRGVVYVQGVVLCEGRGCLLCKGGCVKGRIRVV